MVLGRIIGNLCTFIGKEEGIFSGNSIFVFSLDENNDAEY